MAGTVAGTEPGQRQLNGPQTSGRDYRNLSQPEYEMTRDDDVAVPMRDGIKLLVDVHRPATPGKYPVLDRRLALPAADSGSRRARRLH